MSKLCISQRDGLHVVPLPRIDKLIGQGLDLAIQAERGTAMSVSHLSDHYSIVQIANALGRRVATAEEARHMLGIGCPTN